MAKCKAECLAKCEAKCKMDVKPSVADCEAKCKVEEKSQDEAGCMAEMRSDVSMYMKLNPFDLKSAHTLFRARERWCSAGIARERHE